MRGADLGAWLRETHDALNRGEATWLIGLGRFDAEAGWAIDGQLSGLEWLMCHADLSRATAYEKLRVAAELRRRPIVAAAFGEGAIGYSAVRILTRVQDPDPDVDEALVEVARTGPVVDVERAVATYRRYADQERPLPGPDDQRNVRVLPDPDGTGELRITLTTLELEEVRAVLQGFIDQEYGESPRGDKREPLLGRPDLRADAFMELVRTAAEHAGPGGVGLAGDRYLVHVVTTDGGPPTLPDGTPLDDVEAAMVTCDAGRVHQIHSRTGEPLALGHRHREWNTAQRRAALIRDGGHCRFPGCSHRIADLHHQVPWDDGGPTDLANGFLMCRRHHRLLHGGFTVEGDPSTTLAFSRPDGTPVGSTPATTTVLRRQRRRLQPRGRRRTGPYSSAL